MQAWNQVGGTSISGAVVLRKDVEQGEIGEMPVRGGPGVQINLGEE